MPKKFVNSFAKSRPLADILSSVLNGKKLSTMRTIDVSNIFRDFVNNVEQHIDSLDKQVRSGKAQWKDVNITNAQSEKLAKECLQTISDQNSPEAAKLIETIKDFQAKEFAILRLTGIPQDKIELTDKISIDKTPQLHRANTILAGLLAGPLGLSLGADEPSNRIVKISPKPDSPKHLSWHTDFWKTPATQNPEYIALYGIQNNENITTQFLHAKLIFESLPPKHQEVLLKNIYSCKKNPYYTHDFHSIFQKYADGSVGMIYSGFGDMKGTTAEARESLSYLGKTIADLKESIITVTMKGGDLVLFRNGPPENVIHTRTNIPDKILGSNRRLVLHATADLKNRPAHRPMLTY